nr:beta-galactosidase-1-like protein 3 [Leptinotarsa decemlineata]
MHYFRVPKNYWRDRLRKMRAAGLNTVETYVPWNLHEPRPGEFDFGNGNNDMSEFLNLEEFLKTAQQEDLFAIVRPGPFICAEFEFGGFPSWLLREDDIEVRTSNPVYMKFVTRFFNVLLPILASLQFINGGPILMFQVENEYAVSGKKDLDYLKLLRQQMLDHGIKELLVTSDNPVRGTGGTIRKLFFMAGNFNTDPQKQLDMLKKLQPNKPLMTMEYWSGWYDVWGSRHNNRSAQIFEEVYEEILKYPSSVNIYMFHGGTNFGFMNGAENRKYDEIESDYHSIISSYDYNAPLDEAGRYTDKYYITKKLLEKYNTIKTKLPDVPEQSETTAYTSVPIQEQLSIESALETLTSLQSTKLLPMEMLNINKNGGQSYGYIVYRKKNLHIPANGVLRIEGRVCDTVMVLVNGVLVSPWLQKSADLNKFGTSRVENGTLVLSTVQLSGATLDLVVENWGRVNVRVYKQFKGIWQGGVLLNDEYISNWMIFPLEFKKSWTNELSSWRTFDKSATGPSLYKASLIVNNPLKDTFLDMSNWTKGIAMVNGFVLGRYARMGPIQTLYLPAPFLKHGRNDVIIFEHFKPHSEISFTEDHIYSSH